MSILALAAILWIGTHSGLAGPGPRAWFVGRAGEGGFRIVYSVISVFSLAFLLFAFHHVPAIPLWVAPPWLRGLLSLVMLAAFVLLAAGAGPRNPTAIGGQDAAPAEPRGIVRVTRHPLLWSLTLWAGVHMIGLGTADGLLFFGALLVTSIRGMASIDAKIATKNPALSAALARTTSIMPFGAILAGRNHFVPSEIGWIPPLAGLALWALFLAALHHWLFGVSPL